ncbi:MAG: pantoate--beta-alanine ligase [Bacteroidetes bacterium]|nr:pantoate--beta-alanine ligase [Bacteroidota bacterium]
MEIIHTQSDLIHELSIARQAGRRIGLVPTMGALHEGHLSLIEAISEHCDCVVVSVFVNPLQFGPNEDYSKYPRVHEADARLAEEQDVDFLFIPEVAEMYTAGSQTRVTVGELSTRLCGKSRPGHFDGVTTVVAKLFNIVQPHVAAFGEKDRQQLIIIKRMVEDLNIPVEILAVPTCREADGLAMSSRNAYLSSEERSEATRLVGALTHMEAMINTGESHAPLVTEAGRQLITAYTGARLDYLEIVNPVTLASIDELIPGTDVLLAGAAWFGSTRLIDNRMVKVPIFS